MFEDTQRKEIEELGEFGLIKNLTESLQNKQSSTIFGVGDDAAVLGEGSKKTLISTDMLVEGVHFDLSFHPLKHLGYKAAVVNLSDILAMNGTPEQIVVSIAFSSRFSVQAIQELYEGIRHACDLYSVDLVGGDTSSNRQGLVISITAIGSAEESDIVYRKGAKENDLLCVSGDLGAAYMGLQLLEREKQVFLANPEMQPDLDGFDYILQRQLKPEARLDVLKELKGAGVKPTSMIDISDGLSSEIMHICKNSNVGCKIYSEKIPIDITTCNMANEFNIAPEIAALNGGEDYELLFTVSLKDYEKIKNLKEISVIGNIIDESDGMNLISDDGKQIPITAQGWNGIK